MPDPLVTSGMAPDAPPPTALPPINWPFKPEAPYGEGGNMYMLDKLGRKIPDIASLEKYYRSLQDPAMQEAFLARAATLSPGQQISAEFSKNLGGTAVDAEMARRAQRGFTDRDTLAGANEGQRAYATDKAKSGAPKSLGEIAAEAKAKREAAQK